MFSQISFLDDQISFPKSFLGFPECLLSQEVSNVIRTKSILKTLLLRFLSV